MHNKQSHVDFPFQIPGLDVQCLCCLHLIHLKYVVIMGCNSGHFSVDCEKWRFVVVMEEVTDHNDSQIDLWWEIINKIGRRLSNRK